MDQKTLVIVDELQLQFKELDKTLKKLLSYDYGSYQYKLKSNIQLIFRGYMKSIKAIDKIEGLGYKAALTGLKLDYDLMKNVYKTLL